MNQKADVLLVTATETESRAVFDVFQEGTGQTPQLIPIDTQIYHDLGIVNGTKVLMVQSEMGSGGLWASQQTVQKGISALSPIAVIMVGIAFGIKPDEQSIGDVLVSQRLMLYELQKIGTKGESFELIPREDRPHASPWLLHYFRNAKLCLSKPKYGVKFGPILSGEKLVNNTDFREQLCSLMPEVIGGEMEGAGLYVACQDAKVDWIVVKAICDWADGNKDENKDSRQKLAAKNAASFVLYMLQRMPSIGKCQDPDTDTPIGKVASLIVTRLQELPGDGKRTNEIIEEVVKNNKIEIAPRLRDGDLRFPLAMTMLNLGLRKSVPILEELHAHKLSSENLKSILDLLAPTWVNLGAANCIFKCALHKNHKKAVALNASKFTSSEMYVRRASCLPPKRWPIYRYAGKFGVKPVDEIVSEIENLLILRILKDNFDGFDDDDTSPDDKRNELSQTLKFMKEAGKPVFVTFDYSKSIVELLPYIQNALPYVTLFLLTGENFPQRMELGALDCELLSPSLGLDAERKELSEVKFAYHYLGF